MTQTDTDQTVYAVAFKEGRFLMVWNPKRKGWEMPGGHVKTGETLEEGVVREFAEEAGYAIRVVKMRDLGYCHVFAAVLGEKLQETPEMRVELFDEIPDELFFDRAEYEDVVPWAKKETEGF